ncbi:DLH domain-containing protein [Mycena chlorophos]|uniref:DLH domain-containing protein n=1 Tax=Mycena chlorophos TaxID=658473 RepID=A0A8H6TL81_MYCCL|nr:DLH domain-containing protein [Mycena chlorophos]
MSVPPGHCEDCFKAVRLEGTPEGKMETIGGIECYIGIPAENCARSADKAVLFLTDNTTLTLLELLVDDFARNGFYTVLPDMFEGDPIPADAMDPVTHRLNPSFDRERWFAAHAPALALPIVEKVVAALKERGITRIAATGYCYGARPTVDLALTNSIQVSAITHPGRVALPDLEKYFTDSTAPFLINSCEFDPSFPEDVLPIFYIDDRKLINATAASVSVHQIFDKSMTSLNPTATPASGTNQREHWQLAAQRINTAAAELLQTVKNEREARLAAEETVHRIENELADMLEQRARDRRKMQAQQQELERLREFHARILKTVGEAVPHITPDDEGPRQVPDVAVQKVGDSGPILDTQPSQQVESVYSATAADKVSEKQSHGQDQAPSLELGHENGVAKMPEGEANTTLRLGMEDLHRVCHESGMHVEEDLDEDEESHELELAFASRESSVVGENAVVGAGDHGLLHGVFLEECEDVGGVQVAELAAQSVKPADEAAASDSSASSARSAVRLLDPSASFLSDAGASLNERTSSVQDSSPTRKVIKIVRSPINMHSSPFRAPPALARPPPVLMHAHSRGGKRPFVTLPNTLHPTPPQRPRINITATPKAQHVTRAHCMYHKINLPELGDDDDGTGPRVRFVVPGCSLTDAELMRDEDIQDEGGATEVDGDRMTDRIDTLGLRPAVIQVIRHLVGVDILREREVYYLPREGEIVEPHSHAGSSSISASAIEKERGSPVPSQVFSQTVDGSEDESDDESSVDMRFSETEQDGHCRTRRHRQVTVDLDYKPDSQDDQVQEQNDLEADHYNESTHRRKSMVSQKRGIKRSRESEVHAEGAAGRRRERVKSPSC